MDVERHDGAIAAIAAAISEPARARMLCRLLDGHARTSTELAVVGGVSPSTASVHLARLQKQRLVSVLPQGKHRYYRLAGAEVAAAVEALLVVAGASAAPFQPSTPPRLIAARTCYDHVAGRLGVALHDVLRGRGWLVPGAAGGDTYDLTGTGAAALQRHGIDVAACRALRRRFAFACVDWSERRPHVGGAVGAALLALALLRRWITQDADSRVLTVTAGGRRELSRRFGLRD